MKYEINDGKWGLKLFLKEPWNDRYYRVIKEKKISELELNSGKGWKGSDISFIETLVDLKGFAILHFPIENVSSVNKLINLKSLQVDTYCKTEINFANFPFLEEAFLNWRPKAKSIYNCTTLKRIFIYQYTGEDLTPFHNLSALESMRMKSTRIKKLGDFAPPKLKELEIGLGRGFSSLSNLEKLTSLKSLNINTCRKILNIDEFKYLMELEKVNFGNNGKIASLSPLRNLKKLKEFYFSESTEIEDGDLSVLDELPLLEKVSFQERKHYNRTWKDFGINQ